VLSMVSVRPWQDQPPVLASWTYKTAKGSDFENVSMCEVLAGNTDLRLKINLDFQNNEKIKNEEKRSHLHRACWHQAHAWRKAWLLNQSHF